MTTQPVTTEPLNLLNLARAALGDLRPVLGTPFMVQALRERREETLERALWLLALEGELILDLPHGDFRHLRRGDAVALEAGLTLTLTPLGEAVVLRTEALR